MHPHDAQRGGLSRIAELLDDDRIVAVGECGLDYHYEYSPREVQREVFLGQIHLALDYVALGRWAEAPRKPVRELAFSVDGSQLAVISGDGAKAKLTIWKRAGAPAGH